MLKGIELRESRRLEKYPNEFSATQISLIYGSLLGDACVHRPKGKSYARFQIMHGLKQSEYLNHKFEIMKPWCNMSQPSINSGNHGFGSYGEIIFYTASHPLFNVILDEFYVNGIKRVTSHILNKINEQALAYWFMDDGSHHFVANSKKSSVLKLSTESFTVEENELMRDWFLNKFNLKCSLQLKCKDVYRLHFSQKPTQEFIEIVKSYKIPSMNYKFVL